MPFLLVVVSKLYKAPASWLNDQAFWSNIVSEVHVDRLLTPKQFVVCFKDDVGRKF